MNDYETRKALIENIFEAYGKEATPKRVAIYLAALSDLSTPNLQKALRKVLLQYKFAPQIADIVEAAGGIIGEADSRLRVKEWAEAWREIEKAMWNTPWGKTPKFSTKEIQVTVDSYGWVTLQLSLEKDMPTVRAQVRRMYEDVCRRSKEQKINTYLMGRVDEKLLSKGKQDAPRGIQSVAAILTEGVALEKQPKG